MTTKRSKSHEEQMFFVLQELLPGQSYIINGYYSFLMSPKKRPMQLDIYFPDLNLAFEYNGSQHYKFNRHFYRNKRQFEYLKKCDRLKRKLCQELGITLIVIDYTKEITLEYLKQRIIKAGRMDVLEAIKEGAT